MKYYHVSRYYTPKTCGPLVPSVPDDAWEHDDSDYTTKRICCAPSIGHALVGVFACVDQYYNVMEIDQPPDIIVTSDVICDAEVTGEVWYTHEVMPTHLGVVKLTRYVDGGKCFDNDGIKIPIPYNEIYKWVPDVENACDIKLVPDVENACDIKQNEKCLVCGKDSISWFCPPCNSKLLAEYKTEVAKVKQQEQT